ncbi:uncharacterized protein [Rutidosis leptorrhynchoides]|uniref:uncharacterized protein n=1 Tax=Rutidosis leptorrhynchoides TaxID=125765 RepID=UPI003A98F317
MTKDSGSGDPHKITQVSDLDFGDPIYLHASDTSTTALVTLKLKGTVNYNVWSRAMKSQTDNVLMLQWDRCNYVVLSWILNSISDELYCGQVFAQSAQTVWEELKETYDKIDGSVTFNLHQKLNSLTQGNSTVSDYYHKLNALWKQFDALVKLPTCICEANKEFKTHNDLIKLMQFLMGLDESYASVRISKTFDNKSRIGNGPNPNLKCTRCKRLGHTIERCYEIVGYHPGWVKRNDTKSAVRNNFVPAVNTSDNSSHPFSSEQISQLMSLLHGQSAQGNVHANMTGHPNGTLAKITKIGNLHLTKICVLKDVLVIPGFCVNLLSVNKLSKDYPMFIGFTSNNRFIQDLDLRKVVGMGNEVGGLLGHPATQVLKLLKNSIGINPNSDSDVCDVCHKSIQSRDLFPLSAHTSSKIGELVHLDVWGPYRTSCAYTAQQNGIVERKHRHLLNVARSLLFQSNLTLCYWSDCVLTATYIINRLPSSVLLGRSPFEMIYRFKPSLSHMRVFGCLCFASILNNNVKFSSKSEKCVLLGYSNVKKGYKLLSLESNTILFSRDVKFYETIFPYKLKSKAIDISSDNDHINLFESEFSKPNTSQSPNDEGGEITEEDSGIDQNLIDTPEEETEIIDTTDSNESDSNPEGTNSSSDSENNNDQSNTDVRYPMSNYCNYSNMNDDVKCFSSSLDKSVEPQSYEEVCKDPKWIEAMNNEIEALHRNNTWVVSDLPVGRKAIGCKWIF